MKLFHRFVVLLWRRIYWILCRSLVVPVVQLQTVPNRTNVSTMRLPTAIFAVLPGLYPPELPQILEVLKIIWLFEFYGLNIKIWLGCPPSMTPYLIGGIAGQTQLCTPGSATACPANNYCLYDSVGFKYLCCGSGTSPTVITCNLQ